MSDTKDGTTNQQVVWWGYGEDKKVLLDDLSVAIKAVTSQIPQEKQPLSKEEEVKRLKSQIDVTLDQINKLNNS